MDSEPGAGTPLNRPNHTVHERDGTLLALRSPQPVVTTRRDVVEPASTWNCSELPEEKHFAEAKPRTPATHRRHLNDNESKPIEFKYQDLRSLSLPADQPKGLGLGLGTKTSYESDQSPCDDDIFSGIDDPGILDGSTQQPTVNQSLDTLPPPPPPLPHLPRMNGRILDEKSALKTVNSDITSSVLGGGFVEPLALKRVTSDLTFERMPPPPPPPHQYQYYTEREEGISLLNEVDELATNESVEDRDPGIPQSPKLSKHQQTTRFQSSVPQKYPPKPSSPTKKPTCKAKQNAVKPKEDEIIMEDRQKSNEHSTSGLAVIDPKNLSICDPTNIAGMDGPSIMKMGLSIMHSLSGGMLAFGQGERLKNSVVMIALLLNALDSNVDSSFVLNF